MLSIPRPACQRPPHATHPRARNAERCGHPAIFRVERNEVFGNDGYAFSEPYELVAGDWTFQIWFAGEMMTEQQFLVYVPEDE